MDLFAVKCGLWHSEPKLIFRKVPMTPAQIEFYKRLAHGLALQFGPNCEDTRIGQL